MESHIARRQDRASVPDLWHFSNAPKRGKECVSKSIGGRRLIRGDIF
jgi:hypothetical protein